MESCVDITPFNGRDLVMIKQPGSNRDARGVPVDKIQMSIPEALSLWVQLNEALRPHMPPLEAGERL